MDRASIIKKIQEDIKESTAAYKIKSIQHLHDMYQSGKLNAPLIDLDNSADLKDITRSDAIYTSSKLVVLGNKDTVIRGLQALVKVGGPEARAALALVSVLSPNTAITTPMSSTPAVASSTPLTTPASSTSVLLPTTPTPGRALG